MADLPERHRRIIRQRVDEAVAEVASQASEQAGTQITAAVSLINHLVGELARVTSRSHADILESLQNALVDEDNWY